MNLADFKSISKNCRKLNFFLPISLRNWPQGIFHLIKKVVSPLLLPLQTVFAFKIACFTLLVKIFEIYQTYIPISLQNPTQLIFGLMKKMSARSFRRSRRFFHFKIACFSVLVKIVEIWNYLDLISFKIQHKDLFNEKIVSPLFLPLYIFLFDFAHRLHSGVKKLRFPRSHLD